MKLRNGRQTGGNQARPSENRGRQANRNRLQPTLPAAANLTLTSFTCFLHLPAELRLMIYQLLIKPRVIISNNDTLQPVPVVLQICFESRQEGLRFYKLAHIDRIDKPTSQYLYREDILFVAASGASLTAQIDEIFSVLMSDSIGKEVCKLAVNEDFWKIWEATRAIMGKDNHDLAMDNLNSIIIVEPREDPNITGTNWLILGNDGHETELEGYKAGMGEGVVSNKKPEFGYGRLLRSPALAGKTEITVAPEDWEDTLQFV